MPAFSMVLNCLVYRISSSGWTVFNSKAILSHSGLRAAAVSSRIESGESPRAPSKSFAWSMDSASIKPATVLPLSFTASYR